MAAVTYMYYYIDTWSLFDIVFGVIATWFGIIEYNFENYLHDMDIKQNILETPFSFFMSKNWVRFRQLELF